MILLQHVAFFLLACFLVRGRSELSPSSCSVTDIDERDPALQPMTYDVGDGEQEVLVYVQPDVSTFYRGSPPATTAVTPMFRGFQAKFINMSNKPIVLYWKDVPSGAKYKMRQHKPFTATGTSSFPGHVFFFAAADDPDKELKRYVIGEYPENLYVYDPYTVEGDDEATEKNLKQLTPGERENWQKWKKTLKFNDFYVNKTGRPYLANYLREPAMHFMWRADYFGQEHWITTRETHFATLPPVDLLDPILVYGRKRILKDNEPRLLHEYREKDVEIMNMTLRVVSCSPRVFEIPNFLSQVEVDHILKLAAGIELKKSMTGSVGKHEDSVNDDNRKTRTSYNSWVPREKSPVIDAIYRRSADLMRIPEELLRYRPDGEQPSLNYTKALCEQLQLVHYSEGQEYTAHHDFGFAPIDEEFQGARFATLLFYLNDEGLVGGDTSFPRWVNAETFKELKIKPESGKAVLFYNQLPDGNLDDFSQHAANPVREGEKWLINLWTWDPRYD